MRYAGSTFGLLLALGSTWWSTHVLEGIADQQMAFLLALGLQAAATVLAFAAAPRDVYHSSIVEKIGFALFAAGMSFPVVMVFGAIIYEFSVALAVDPGRFLVFVGAMAALFGGFLVLGFVWTSIPRVLAWLDRKRVRPAHSPEAYEQRAKGWLLKIGGLAVLLLLVFGQDWRIDWRLGREDLLNALGQVPAIVGVIALMTAMVGGLILGFVGLCELVAVVWWIIIWRRTGHRPDFKATSEKVFPAVLALMLIGPMVVVFVWALLSWFGTELLQLPARP